MKDDDGGEIIVKITSISSVQKHKSQNFFFSFFQSSRNAGCKLLIRTRDGREIENGCHDQIFLDSSSSLVHLCNFYLRTNLR